MMRIISLLLISMFAIHGNGYAFVARAKKALKPFGGSHNKKANSASTIGFTSSSEESESAPSAFVAAVGNQESAVNEHRNEMLLIAYERSLERMDELILEDN